MSRSQKTVLITGGTDGLGKAAAIFLAERGGYRVFAAGRSAEKRQEMDRVAMDRHLPIETVEMDVTADGSVQAAVQSRSAKGRSDRCAD